MSNTRSIPTLATAGVTLAAAAPALAIGAAIGLGLLWLFRDDEKPQTATATPGNEPPAPDAKRQNSGWFLIKCDRESTAPPAPVVTQTMPDEERQQHVRDNEAEITRIKRKMIKHAANEARTQAELNRERQRIAALNPAPAPVPVRVVPAPRPASAVTTPAKTIAAASPAPVVTGRPSAPHVALPARPGTVQAAAPQTAEPKFSGWAPKVKREDLAAIFENGAKRLTRKEAVAALISRGVKKTTAYHTLRDGGRFSNLLEMGADGLLALRV